MTIGHTTLAACGCNKRPSIGHCSNCARPLCRWHTAQSPVSIDGAIYLTPVCMPECRAPFWKNPEAVTEWRPAKS